MPNGRHSRGFRVDIEDTTRSLAALALQGPTSRAILNHLTDGDVDSLRFFGALRTTLRGLDVVVTRTGYTGDLGYEIWIQPEDAIAVWDGLTEVGADHGLEPIGLDALDLSRVEAGFILAGVDYRSASMCLREDQSSTPYEAGLGWTVKLERDPFIGQKALLTEWREKPAWDFVGLEISWKEVEEVFATRGLPPSLSSSVCRDPIPLYSGGQQVGYASSTVWSPMLKRYIGLATVPAHMASIGQSFEIEVLVDQWRHRVTATVAKKPFFDPERKRK